MIPIHFIYGDNGAGWMAQSMKCLPHKQNGRLQSDCKKIIQKDGQGSVPELWMREIAPVEPHKDMKYKSKLFSVTRNLAQRRQCMFFR